MLIKKKLLSGEPLDEETQTPRGRQVLAVQRQVRQYYSIPAAPRYRAKEHVKA